MWIGYQLILLGYDKSQKEGYFTLSLFLLPSFPLFINFFQDKYPFFDKLAIVPIQTRAEYALAPIGKSISKMGAANVPFVSEIPRGPKPNRRDVRILPVFAGSAEISISQKDIQSTWN